MYHPSFYPQSQPLFQYNRRINSFYRPSYPSPMPNHSSQNLNLKGFPMAFNGWNQQRYRPNLPRTQQPYRPGPAIYFQDKSTFYYMSDPMTTQNNRIAIQLTKVHIGPNGDQQRVHVEQEFSNRIELKKFMKNLRSNFGKTFKDPSANVPQSEDNLQADNKRPGTIVVEEPDEEPKVYEQEVYNEHIQSKPSPSKHRRSTAFASSCSTIRSNRHRRNKIKYQRQKVNKQPNQEQQPTIGKLASFAPVQQRFSNRPNAFYSSTQARSYFTRRNEEERPPLTTTTTTTTTKPRFHRVQHLGNQPSPIKTNLVFKANEGQQTRVQSIRSECPSVFLPLNKFNGFQRPFMPMLAPKRGVRNLLGHFRLFNPYRAH